jgi:hypothetical protein
VRYYGKEVGWYKENNEEGGGIRKITWKIINSMNISGKGSIVVKRGYFFLGERRMHGSFNIIQRGVQHLHT